MAIIKPTVGRVVLFRPSSNSVEPGFSFYGQQPCAAVVAYVHSDTMVNLTVFDHVGNPHSRTSVPLVQDDDEYPQGSYCEWMPYQKGQAAKTEQLERAIAESPPKATRESP